MGLGGGSQDSTGEQAGKPEQRGTEARGVRDQDIRPWGWGAPRESRQEKWEPRGRAHPSGIPEFCPDRREVQSIGEESQDLPL